VCPARRIQVDGNHEDSARLDAHPIDEDGRRRLSDHVWHLPRGFRWQWGDSTWVAVGGAVSVDKQYRIEGKTWFAAEELTSEEADLIIAAGPADIVVAHDAPLGVPFLRGELRQDLPAWRRDDKVAWPIGALMRSDEHQRRVRRVASCRYKASAWTWIRLLLDACWLTATASRSSVSRIDTVSGIGHTVDVQRGWTRNTDAL